MPLRVVAGPGAQGRPCKLVKSTQTGKTDAETALTTVSKERSVSFTNDNVMIILETYLAFACLLKRVCPNVNRETGPTSALCCALARAPILL